MAALVAPGTSSARELLNLVLQAYSTMVSVVTNSAKSDPLIAFLCSLIFPNTRLGNINHSTKVIWHYGDGIGCFNYDAFDIIFQGTELLWYHGIYRALHRILRYCHSTF